MREIPCVSHLEKLQEEFRGRFSDFLAVEPIVTFTENPFNTKDISKTALNVE
jgi:hypothetical protein